MALSNDIQEIPRLIGETVEQLGKLVQNEADLARAEMSQKIAQAALGAAYIVGAAMLAIPVLVLVLISLAIWFTQLGLSPILAHLCAAACGAFGSAILGLVGKRFLKAEKLKLRVTMRQFGDDVQAMKEMSR